MSRPTGFKLETKHGEGCFVMRDSDEIQFVVVDAKAPVARLDALGRKPGRGAGVEWHRYRCNDPRCPARMLVRWDVLARFVSTMGASKTNEGA